MTWTPRDAFVVSHTHWDLEWYLPFSRFKVAMVDVVGRVLDALEGDPAFGHFVLDGQAAVIEDYLEAVPGDRERVRRLVRAGRLAVGPWYVLPDNFLIPSEAAARNLLLGRRTCAPLGAAQAAGYMPDSFGHPAQMPQLLQLAGLDSFIFTRGLGDEADRLGWLFRWRAPDGSEVLAVNQCDGYCNAGALGFAELWHAHTRRAVEPDRAVAKVRELFAKMAARPGAEPALLNNGCDHFPPQQDLAAVLGALGEAFPGTRFVHGRFEDFLAAARAHTDDEQRPLHEGELLGGRDHPILSGVWSTRMPLKQRNAACHAMLAGTAEPLLAAALFLEGDAWPRGLLDAAWRDLLRNQPHDSICGCSIDEVHREMHVRFDRVEQTARHLVGRLLDRRLPMFARHESGDRETVVDVANPLPIVRDEVVERLVVLPPGGRNLDTLRVVDDEGRPVPFRITNRRFLERFWGIDYRMELFADDQRRLLDDYLEPFAERFVGTEADRDVKDCFLDVEILARGLPAVGAARFRIVEGDGPTADDFTPVRARREGTAAVLENGRLRLALYGDGTFDLEDLEHGRMWPGLGRLEDEADTGDEYDFCPAAEPGLVSTAGCRGKVDIARSSDLVAEAEARCVLDLPCGLEHDRRRRTAAVRPCPVTVRVRLAAGSRRAEVTVTFANEVADHRLRAVLPTGLVTDHVLSDGVFRLERRPVLRPGGEGWTQPAPAEWPQHDFSALGDGRHGLAVLVAGLPEFSTAPAPGGGVDYRLTLLRSVGWLSRDDLPSRNNINAGPTLAAPEAQCPGRHTFRYAVVPYAGDPLAAGIRDESDRWRTPPPSHQGVTDGARPAGRSLVAKSRPEVAVTAVKAAERGRALVLRLVNLADTPLRETLTFGLPVLEAEKTGILETELPVDRAPVAVIDGGRRVRVPLDPCEIATVVVTFAEEDDR